ncbi:MAG: B12-binding domain-containing radical SAM protein [Deltaproteobacteria bacterium]|nr:B12-binding domain-containing radical SAM protein [Deltaproteobacteria bacterium]
MIDLLGSINKLMNLGHPKIGKNLILLIKPDYKFFPVGLTYVASTLERCGYSYDFIDMSFEDYSQLNKLMRNKYKIVMTGGIVGEFEEIEKICQFVKNISPAVKVIIGGLITRDVSKSVLSKLRFDYAVVGEAEDTLPELLEYCLGKKQNMDHLQSIKGIMFRSAEGQLVATDRRPRIDITSRSLLPSTNLSSLEKWLSQTNRSLPVLTGRGCYGKCTFCSPSFRQFKGRPFEEIFKEIQLFSEKFTINMINFTNEVLFKEEDEIISFCQEYKNRFNIPFTAALRLDISPRVLKELKAAGCIAVGVGIESASDKVLNKMQKSITNQDTMKFLRHANDLKLNISSGFMINNEGETEEDIDNTLSLQEELKITSGLSLTIPYPGTIIYKRAVKRGLISDEYNFLRSQQIFYNKVQFLPECLFIIDEAIGKPLLPNLTDIPEENFVSVMSRAYARFYRSNELKNVSLNPDASKIKGQCPKCGLDCEFDFNPIAPVVRNLSCPKTATGECHHAFQFAAHIFSNYYISDYEQKIKWMLEKSDQISIVGDPFNIKFLFAYRIFDLCDRNIVAMGNPENDKTGQYVFYDGYKHVMPISRLLDIETLVQVDFDKLLIAYMPPYSHHVQQNLIASGIPENKIIQMCPEELLFKG